MKKIIAAILVLVLSLLCLAGCGGEDVSSTDTSSEITSSDIVSSDENTSSEDVSSGDASSGEENSSEEESSKPTSSSTQTTPTIYSTQIFLFTEFSDTYPFDIDTVVDFGVGEVTQSKTYLTESDEGGMWKKYTVPEVNMLKALRKTFVITDDFWAAIKDREVYNLGADDCNYMDGNFYITVVGGWGGGMEETFYLKKTIDDKAGTISLYYLYLVDDLEQHYIELVYTYTGSASYQVVEPEGHYYAGNFVSTSKAFIDSLRLKSVKKVHNFPGNTEAQKKYDYFHGETTYYFFWYENDPTHIELYGCGGEFAIDCGCDEPGKAEKWNFDANEKTVTCPCGEVTMTNILHEANVYR